jgi:hypothetical protein
MGDNLPDGVSHSDIDEHFGEPEYNREEGEIIVSFYEEQDSERDNPKDYVKEELEYKSLADTTEIVHIEVEDNNDLELIAEVTISVVDDEVPDYEDDEKIEILSDMVEIKNNPERAEVVEYNLI